MKLKPAERRRFRFRLLLGTWLTLLVVLIDSFSMLDWFERKLYDLRCRYCQYFLSKPKPPVCVDIDEPALQEIGAWPWPRDKMAAILDDLGDAGAKVVAMDILFSEPKPEDKQLAATIAARKNVVIGVELQNADPETEAGTLGHLRKALERDLELSPEAARAVLESEGVAFDDAQYDFGSELVGARKEAMIRRISQEIDDGRTDQADLRQRLFPGSARLKQTPIYWLFEQSYDVVVRMNAMRRFTRAADPGTDRAMRGLNRSPPVLSLTQAAAASGFVNYDPDPDGAVRAVPLWREIDGRMLPQLGFATTLLSLGVKPEDVRISSDSIVIPRKAPDHDITIPVYRRNFGHDKGVAYCMPVPMFGNRSWQTMYDVPNYRNPTDHISAIGVYRIDATRKRIAENQKVVDPIIIEALKLVDLDDDANKYLALEPSARPREARIAQASKQIPVKLAELAEIANPPPEIVANIQLLKEDQRALAQYPNADQQLRNLLDDYRKDLANRVKGRTVFIGWMATGQLDMVTTPIHQRCPGVVVHGAIYNAIMSGELWTVAPHGITIALIILMGMITSSTLARVSPGSGILIALLLVAVYAVINGLLLFDYGNIVVGAASPIASVAIVWAGMTLFRVITEIRERHRITKRFQSYVDPSLVTYVIEHPELARLEGEIRELTVVFTDLAGFTTLTEKLGPAAVKILSRYKSKMVPVIRKHRGFVHCFMGDGIMFSYGAPEPNPEHFVDAIATVMEMQHTMEKFNQEIVAEGYPALGMRAGVSTGNVVIGDSGSEDACDYAALGDASNLGARLESANKAFGTHILISERTADLLQDRYLLRPIAGLVVAGKTQAVMTYEPLAKKDSATDEQRQLAAATVEMVKHYAEGRFAECVAAADAMDQRFGPSKLTKLYRDTCNRYIADPPKDFRGEITLTEK
jgi:CHASE2 domain-containing sensor protein/class 3 adenylate cyclase